MSVGLCCVCVVGLGLGDFGEGLFWGGAWCGGKKGRARTPASPLCPLFFSLRPAVPPGFLAARSLSPRPSRTRTRARSFVRTTKEKISLEIKRKKGARGFLSSSRPSGVDNRPLSCQLLLRSSVDRSAPRRPPAHPHDSCLSCPAPPDPSCPSKLASMAAS